jgi:hypothetical protein
MHAQLVRCIVLDTQVLIHAQLVRIVLETQVLIHAQLVLIVLNTQVLIHAQLVRIVLDTQVLIHAQLVRIVQDTQVLVHAQLVRIVLETQVLTKLDSLVHWTSSPSFQVADQAHTVSRATFLCPFRHCKANTEAFLCGYVPNTLHNCFKTVCSPSHFKITGFLLTITK